MKSVNLQHRITCKSWILEISYEGCTFQMRIVYKGNDKFMKIIDRTLATKSEAERSATLIMICDPPLIPPIQLSIEDQKELYRIIPTEESIMLLRNIKG